MRFKPVWSDVFMLGLIALAATPLFPAPDRLSTLSITAPLGHWLYVGGLFALSLGFFWRRGIENAAESVARAELNDKISCVESDAAQHYADSEQRYQTQMAEQQRQHDTQMVTALEHTAELREVNKVLVSINQQLKQPDVADAPPIKVAALNSAASLAEAVLAEEAYMTFSPPVQHQWWVPPIQPSFGNEELPLPMRELQAALRGLEQNPPTDPGMALATAKQLSSLSQAIPNTPTGHSIAEHKAEVSNISMPSESSSGAHRPPTSSS